MSEFLKKFWANLLFVSTIIVAHALFYYSPYGQRAESYYLDFLFQIRGEIPTSNEVAIISMDESSYQNLGLPLNQAWPRKLHAKLLNKLSQFGVKRVIFDVLFLDPGQEPNIDSELSKAFSMVPSVIGADEGVAYSAYGNSTQLLTPYTPFMNAADEVALVGLPEEFGAIRKFRIVGSGADTSSSFRSLAFAAANVQHNSYLPDNNDLINFYGPAGTITNYSYYQILEESVPFPGQKLKDKIIFIGQQLRSGVGPDQKDSFLTSFPQRGRHYGVEIHATSAANILSQNWIKRFPLELEIIFLSLLLALAGIILSKLAPMRALSALVVFELLWLVVSVSFFNHGQIFVPGLAAFAICLPILFVGKTLASYLSTKRTQLKLEQAFSRYLSPHMAKVVSKNPDALSLGGEKVVATAMFTDLEGFTSICETMPAEDVTSMLNEYLSLIVEDVFEFDGTLIKFIGDSVFALWGAPIKNDNHAEAAIHAAMCISERLNKSEALKKFPTLKTRIGIHTGPMVVGNLGSKKRFDFTAVGDSVNIASRIEGLNKYLGTTILISGAVVESSKTDYDTLYIGKVKALGKSESISLYTILSPEQANLVREDFTQAIKFFEAKQWDLCIEAFKACATKHKILNQACNFYIDQAKNHALIEPPDNWAGELQATGK